MGDESTCQKTKTAGSCPAGTIILYKVNNNNIVGFNVLEDKGSTILMQSQRKIVNNTEWAPNSNTSGPTTILSIIANVTSSWSNVNNQTYSIGDSSSTLGYSGCSEYNSCTATTYPKLEKSNVKARMITVQEAVNYGECTNDWSTCKRFMTADGDEAYWTTSANSSNSSYVWLVAPTAPSPPAT